MPDPASAAEALIGAAGVLAAAAGLWRPWRRYASGERSWFPPCGHGYECDCGDQVTALGFFLFTLGSVKHFFLPKGRHAGKSSLRRKLQVPRLPRVRRETALLKNDTEDET